MLFYAAFYMLFFVISVYDLIINDIARLCWNAVPATASQQHVIWCSALRQKLSSSVPRCYSVQSTWVNDRRWKSPS